MLAEHQKRYVMKLLEGSFVDEQTFDLVVVGAGTGMLAALIAAEAGLSVLVVEKSQYFGGSTALSGGGFWIPGNPLLRDQGVEDDPKRAADYLREVVGEEAPEDRWQSYLQHGPDAARSLERLTPLKFAWMPDYPDYFPEVSGGSSTGRAMEPRAYNVRRLGAARRRLRPPALEAPFPMPVSGRTYRWLNLVARTPRGVFTGARLLGMGLGGLAIGREYAAGGSALAAGLFSGLQAKKVPVWFESPLIDLIVKDGRVTGVKIVREDRPVTVHARRGVILSSGGFDHNAAMRREYQSQKLDTSWALGSPDNTGDVFAIAESVGADLTYMEEAWWFPAIPLPGPMPGTLLAERSLPGQIMVNQDGLRFMNEAVNYMTAGKILLEQDLPVWMVFDQRYRNSYVYSASVFPRQQLPQDWYDAGVAHRAPTLAQLAETIDAPGLIGTVDRFNAMARSGRDDDFQRGDSAYDRYYGDPTVKPNPCLRPLGDGPYYAVQVVPGDLGTCGGVRADRHARALRADGTAIEGLYVIGNAAGNAFGRVYPGPGATIGQGLVFGHIAALHAAGQLNDARVC